MCLQKRIFLGDFLFPNRLYKFDNAGSAISESPDVKADEKRLAALSEADIKQVAQRLLEKYGKKVLEMSEGSGKTAAEVDLERLETEYTNRLLYINADLTSGRVGDNRHQVVAYNRQIRELEVQLEDVRTRLALAREITKKGRDTTLAAFKKTLAGNISYYRGKIGEKENAIRVEGGKQINATLEVIKQTSGKIATLRREQEALRERFAEAERTLIGFQSANEEGKIAFMIKPEQIPNLLYALGRKDVVRTTPPVQPPAKSVAMAGPAAAAENPLTQVQAAKLKIDELFRALSEKEHLEIKEGYKRSLDVSNVTDEYIKQVTEAARGYVESQTAREAAATIGSSVAREKGPRRQRDTLAETLAKATAEESLPAGFAKDAMAVVTTNGGKLRLRKDDGTVLDRYAPDTEVKVIGAKAKKANNILFVQVEVTEGTEKKIGWMAATYLEVKSASATPAPAPAAAPGEPAKHVSAAEVKKPPEPMIDGMRINHMAEVTINLPYSLQSDQVASRQSAPLPPGTTIAVLSETPVGNIRAFLFKGSNGKITKGFCLPNALNSNTKLNDDLRPQSLGHAVAAWTKPIEGIPAKPLRALAEALISNGQSVESFLRNLRVTREPEAKDGVNIPIIIQINGGEEIRYLTFLYRSTNPSNNEVLWQIKGYNGYINEQSINGNLQKYAASYGTPEQDPTAKLKVADVKQILKSQTAAAV